MKNYSGLRFLIRSLALGLTLTATNVFAVTLTDFKSASSAGDVTEIELVFDGTPPEISGYTIEKPARIALDLPGVTSDLKSKRHELGTGNARSAMVVEAKDRARVVINLNQLVGYTTQVQGNKLFVRVGDNGESKAFTGNVQTSSSGVAVNKNTMKVVNVDFRRGNQGEGQVQISLSAVSYTHLTLPTIYSV